MTADAAGEPRTLAPPSRRIAPVAAVRTLGAYTLISARDEHGPPRPRPGQFYMLAAVTGWGGGAGERPYLPRAFSFAAARAGDGGPELDFLLEDVGPGTHRLGELAAGDGLGLLGPLGIGFSTAEPGTRPLLVGGGIGAAPMLCLSQELGPEAAVILGFRTGAHAVAAELFESARVMTEDGSAGDTGLVTAPLTAELDRDPAATVFACGPPAMLEAVRALCAERSIACRLALESGMACGYGACFGCVVPTREGYIRLCLDGPVLDAARLETALVAGGHAG